MNQPDQSKPDPIKPGPNEPGPNEPGDDVVLPKAMVRVVLYTPGEAENSADAVTAHVFYPGADGKAAALSAADVDFRSGNPGAPYSVSVGLPEGWEDNWVNVDFNAAGRMEFTLTPEGAAQMKALGLAGKDLVDFIRVTVTDNATGEEFAYNVEFVGTNDPNFDSAAHDAAYGATTGDMGEYHQGKGLADPADPYDIISTGKNDEIILNDTVHGGSNIHASGSADLGGKTDANTINLNKGVSSTEAGKTTHITSADGELKVQEGVLAQDGGANFMNMGKGDASITGEEYGATASSGGKNIIAATGNENGEGGTVAVSGAGYGLKAASGGTNEITGQKVEITASTEKTNEGLVGGFAVSEEDGIVVAVASVNGKYADAFDIPSQDALKRLGNELPTVASFGMSADGGTNSVIAGESVSVTGGKYGLHAENKGANNLTSGGDISIAGGDNYFDWSSRTRAF